LGKTPLEEEGSGERREHMKFQEKGGGKNFKKRPDALQETGHAMETGKKLEGRTQKRRGS